ncbi:MAG: hypothetical protein MH204_09520 [Fimbriimonadaceae bacterium]|nr:hypothetical protein [Fimbriimonadaceae bacterium]
MALTALICSAIIAAPAEPVALTPAQIPTAVPFTAYRMVDVPVGYSLVKSELHTLAGGRKVLKLRYLNRSARNEFDILQTEAGSGSTESLVRSLTREGALNVSVLPESTFVWTRRGRTDIALIGTLLSDPSAMEILKSSRPWTTAAR